MTLHVVGGVYREYCVHPRWNEIYGSAGRAAIAIATVGTSVVLHSYMDDDAQKVINEKGVWLEAFASDRREVSGIVSFTYLHDMAVPVITGRPKSPHPPLVIEEDKVVRFGMLEGEAVVRAKWAVYDPQNVRQGQPFDANGSTADHLALVLNAEEAAFLANMPGRHPSETAPVLGEQQGAEVVVVKMGPEGAFVWTAVGTDQVPAFKTSRVWKIGSGDCFVAHFANAWMHEGKPAIQAAVSASKAAAYYCETQGFPTNDILEEHAFSSIELSQSYLQGVCPRVYLAGPFFDLSQVWMVTEAYKMLRNMGLRVFSPYHHVGLGSADDVVTKDLEGIVESDLVLALFDGLDPGTIYEIGYARALSKPVVVYSERHKGESLKMMEGSGCIIRNDFTTALYTTLWEAVKI